MNRSRNNRNDVDVYQERSVGASEPRRPSNKRPLWYLPACTLIVLMITELVLIGTVFIRFGSSINYMNVPIVSGPESSATAIVLPDMDEQEPDTAPTEDDEADYNLDVGDTPIYQKDPIDSNVINILVLGLDTREPGGNGRSDVNMIVSIDRKNKTIKLASMLRDTLVPIEGHDYNRLNTAYLFGGPGLAINTVNSIYNMDIQRFVKVDFFSIMDIVDAVGGVDIDMTSAEVTYMRNHGHSISRGAGVKHLNGEEALTYARIRKIDSDFGRTQRQRNVVTAALKNVRKMGLVKALDLMNELLPQVTTNISTNEMVSLATEVVGMNEEEMDQISLPAEDTYTGKYYKKMAILAVDFDKNTEILHEFLYGK